MVVEIINTVLDPLKINPTITILLVSFLMSLVITILNKYLVNQDKVKQIKDEIKELQNKMKADPSKSGECGKQIMSKTKQQLMLTLRSMFVSLPVGLILFLWLSGSVAYEQIDPSEEFDVIVTFEKGTADKTLELVTDLEVLDEDVEEDRLLYTLRGSEGTHTLTYNYQNEQYTQDVLITTEWEYLDNELSKTGTLLGFGGGEIQKESQIKKIKVDLEPVAPLGKLIFWTPGWIMSYLIFAIVFSILLKKVFKTQI